MIGCTRCGRWHLDAEKVLGERLSCTQVKEFWLQIKLSHKNLYGHFPHISTDDAGNWICSDCGRKLPSLEISVSSS